MHGAAVVTLAAVITAEIPTVGVSDAVVAVVVVVVVVVVVAAAAAAAVAAAAVVDSSVGVVAPASAIWRY